MRKIRRFFRHLKSRYWCWYTGCDGQTGAYSICINCPAYTPNRTNCDIPDDKD